MSEFLGNWNEKSGRVIVLAGVFDPVHKGHIAIAKKAELHHGEHVVFLPERVPQHKHSTVSYEHRLEMAKIAAANEKDLSVLDYPEDQHWVTETFTWLGKKFPDRKFAWLVGSDVAGNIETWQGSDKLLSLNVNLIIVAQRTGMPFDIPVGPKIAGVETTYIRSKHKHTSSGFIRKDIENRHSNLPDGVYEYIKKNNLYS